MSASITARNSMALPAKLEYTAPLENPAVRAICSSLAPWNPYSANTLFAARIRAARVACCCSCRVGGSGACVIGFSLNQETVDVPTELKYRRYQHTFGI